MHFSLYLTTSFPPMSAEGFGKRKRDNDESDSDSDSDIPSSPESSPRPRKVLSPPRKFGAATGLPPDEPLNIDSRLPMSIPPGRRPRSRALVCLNHSWDCQICGK